MNVTCKACGWVAFEVSREHAEAEVIRFNEYFDNLSKKEQNDYYGGKGATLHLYERCMLCNGLYTNFRDAEVDDCPMGCTLSPIINRED